MKTQIIMAIMGIFFALSNISYAGSFNNNLPECCKKQEACCVKDAACCNGQKVSQSLKDCCEQKNECCESANACCDTNVGDGKVIGDYKQSFTGKAKVKNQKNSCCN